MVPLRYSIFLPLLLPSSFPSFFTLYLPPPPFSLPPSSPQPSGAKTTCHAYSMKQSAQRPLRIATAWQGRDVAQSTPLKVLYQCAGVNNNESKSMERLFPLAVEYHLGTFAEKYSTWDFYERNSTKTQETNCPLNPKYGVIFCVRVNYKGACVEKPQEIISHIWEKGDNLSLRSTSRARKRVCLSSNTGLCFNIHSLLLPTYIHTYLLPTYIISL